MIIKSVRWMAAAGLIGLCSWAGWSRADEEPATRPATPASQPAPSGVRRPQPGEFLSKLQGIVDGLNLSSDQKPKVDALFEKAKDDLKTAREQITDQRELNQKLREVFNDVRDGLKGILTPEQAQAFAKQLPGNGRGAGGPAQALQRLTKAMDQLSLSEDQKKQVADVLKDAREQLEKIREEAKNGETDAREKIQSTIQDARQKLEGVLSAEQQQKLQEIRQQQPAPGNGVDGPAPH